MQRLLALSAVSWFRWRIGPPVKPVKGALIACDH
jgi:hypothetical protein